MFILLIAGANAVSVWLLFSAYRKIVKFAKKESLELARENLIQ